MLRAPRPGATPMSAQPHAQAWFEAPSRHRDVPLREAMPIAPAVSTAWLSAQLRIGDVVFIRAAARPFREVAAATDSWVNHVGIVVSKEGREPLIGESTFPFSRTTRLSRFVARSEQGRVAVARLPKPLSFEEQHRLIDACLRRSGVFYDTGFNLRSGRQFCSRYVREVLLEATGVELGEIETFADLLQRHPEADQGFWKLWYFGRIPWQRETVTPASLLRSETLQCVFDGQVAKEERRARRQRARAARPC